MQRENNYDLLRITCAIAVIVIHVSTIYKNAMTDEKIFGTLYTYHIVTTLIYNTISRFAVPCFVMLSGCFALSNEKNAEYKYFYRKTFRKIGIPTLIFSLLYFTYSMIKSSAKVVIMGNNWTEMLLPISNMLKGSPFYHMWYLYMMIVVYLLVPVLHRYKKDIKADSFNRVTWIFLAAASISAWTSERTVNWDVGGSFCYLGYFMAGYVICKWAADHKNNMKGVCVIAMGFVIELALTYLEYNNLMKVNTTKYIKFDLMAPQCPLIVISSVLIFAGFSMINVNKKLGKLSENTFLIYLLHAGVWEAVEIVGRGMLFETGGDNRIIIPVSVIIVFLLSYVLAILYKKVWYSIDKKFGISDKMCKLIRL